MRSTWILRGTKAKRVTGAALIDATFATLAAHVNGKNALVYGLAHALAGAEAMSHHRLRDRARAHERNSKLAEAWAEVLEKALSRPGATNCALPTTATGELR